MPKYIATFRTDADYAERVFTARTPEAALASARRFHEDRPEDLIFEEYTHGMPVNEIEISDRNGEQIAVWRDADLRQRLAGTSCSALLRLKPTPRRQSSMPGSRAILPLPSTGSTTLSHLRVPLSSTLGARPGKVRYERAIPLSRYSQGVRRQ